MLSIILSEFAEVRQEKRAWRQFGLLIWLVAWVIAFFAWRAAGVVGPAAIACALIGALFALGAVLAPARLRPSYSGWMFGALIMGYIMTRVILTLTFFLMITPIGTLLKLLRIPLIDVDVWRRRREVSTFWGDTDADKTAERLRQMF
jgi:hypothetical protein